MLANNGDQLDLTWEQFLLTESKIKIRKLSDMVKDRQVKLLGHIIRTEYGNPMHQVIFDEYLHKAERSHKRVGKPREHWTDKIIQRAFELVYQQEYDQNDEMHVEHLRIAAVNRQL